MSEKLQSCIDRFKAFKEDLNKNVNQSYEGGTPNSLEMSESEPHKDDPHHEEKEQKKAKKIKREAQDLLDMHKMAPIVAGALRGAAMGALAGGVKGAMSKEERCEIAKNGQWSLTKKTNLKNVMNGQQMFGGAPIGPVSPSKKDLKKGYSAFKMEHAHEVLGMDHEAAKKHLHGIVAGSNATQENRAKLKHAINSSRNTKDLSRVVSNHILAAGDPEHKTGSLKVIK